MAEADDWRRAGQEEYLVGATLHFEAYEAESAEWDHDHCEFCMAKFCEGELTEGWVTQEGGKRWICTQCFEDFRDEFRFVVS